MFAEKGLKEKRVPASRFGTLWSLMSSSINVAGSLSPLAAAFLVARLGWRWNVFLAGLLSIFLGFLFLLFRSFLSKTPVSENDKAQKAKPAGACTRALLGSPLVWLLCASFAIVFSARTTAVDWGQLYLIEDRGHSRLTASAFTSSFELGGLVGRITAGYVSDRVVRNASTSRKGSARLSVGLLFLVGAWLAAHWLRFHVSDRSSPACVMGVGASLGLCLYGVIAVVGIVAAESVPPPLSGASNAVVSLFGNLGSVLSGLPLSCLAGHYGWSSVFLLLEILLAGNCLLLLCCRNARPGKWHQS